MLAYNNDPALKKKYLDIIKVHRDAGRIQQGVDRKAYPPPVDESYLVLCPPIWLGWWDFADDANLTGPCMGLAIHTTFDGMPPAWAPDWPGTVMEHLKVGTDMIAIRLTLNKLGFSIFKKKLDPMEGARQLIKLLDNAPLGVM